MNNNNSYYPRNGKKLVEQAKNQYYKNNKEILEQ